MACPNHPVLTMSTCLLSPLLHSHVKNKNYLQILFNVFFYISFVLNFPSDWAGLGNVPPLGSWQAGKILPTFYTAKSSSKRKKLENK
jgi:hypothetical protein